jgi:hypothetical protein
MDVNHASKFGGLLSSLCRERRLAFRETMLADQWLWLVGPLRTTVSLAFWPHVVWRHGR